MVLQRFLSGSRTGTRHLPVSFAATLAALLYLLPATAWSQQYSEVSLACYRAVAGGNPQLFSKPCRAAVDAGDAHAMFLLAERTTDAARRQQLLESAALKNHPRAIAAQADSLRNEGKTRRAFERDRRAASLGYEPSRIRVAAALRATGQPGNVQRARQLFLQSARAGFPQAQFTVAVMMGNGEGGEVDNNGALLWLTEAASGGLPRAQYELGAALSDSQPEMAAGWLTKAARAGNLQAMIALARQLALNKGIRQDLGLAAYWAHQAIRNGHPDGVAVLNRINSTPARQTGQNGPDMIKRTQELLNALGYNAGKPDGIIGSRTRKAISAFQNDRSIEQTGEPSALLLQQLLQAL